MYQDYCRKNNLEIHPARFPAQLPEYFMRMLTDPNDVVVDPFAGSCVTGMVAETLGRQWVCIELSESYLKGAVGRFAKGKPAIFPERLVQYSIHSPCSIPSNGAETPLPQDGGKARPIMTATQQTHRQKSAKIRSRRVGIKQSAVAGSQ
jgi:site-specific DNA-methyltransferase (cytosine-N4-specific)